MPHRQLSEVISTNIRGVAPDTPIVEVLWLMRNENISCVLVILNDTPIGILTERDLLRATDKILAGRKLETRDLMSQPVLTIEKKGTLNQALSVMRENRIRHLIVSADGFSILGMLTLTDILKKIVSDCLFEQSTVDAIMAQKVYTVKRGTSIMRVLHAMANNDLSCIVIAENNEALGIITERDLVWLLTEKPELWSMQIDDIMSIPVTTVSSKASPQEAAELVIQESIRHLVVVDENKKITGLLTQSLLCHALNCLVSVPERKSA